MDTKAKTNGMTILLSMLLAVGLQASSAYALTAGNGTWMKETTLFGLTDAYTYVPKNAAPEINSRGNGGRALMLALHGCAQKANPNVINKGFNWEATAEKYGMVVVAPSSRANCWDWVGDNHTRTTREDVQLLKLVEAITTRAGLDIDPNQVYVSGLSAGASETLVLGCLAPDVFAGIGANSAANIGPTKFGIGSPPDRTAAQIAASCQSMAATDPRSSGKFATQIMGNIHGTSDTIVPPAHQPLISTAFKSIYGASTCTAITVDSASTTKTAAGTECSDATGNKRVSTVLIQQFPHAWAAGPGGSGGGKYVDYSSVSYPAHLTKWLFDNNMRLKPVDPCALPALSASGATPGAAGGSGSFGVTQKSGCAWTANSNASWLSLTSGSSYTGSQTVNYSVAANSAAAGRVATITASGKPFTVTQGGTGPACTYSLSPSSASVAATSVTGSFNVATNDAGCAWGVVSNDNWITITSGAGGMGNAAVSYSAAANTAPAPRSGTVTAGDQIFTVNQAADVTPATCYTATNYAHVKAGRAYDSMGTAKANGSNESMGLYNIFTTTTLRKTGKNGPDYYVIGTCP